MRKKAAWVVSVALLLITGFAGVANGIRELDNGVTGLQRSVTFAVLVYGVLGLLGGVGLLRRRPWVPTVATVWTLAATYAGSVASFAYHDPGLKDPSTFIGIIAAFVSILLMGAFVVWTARSATGVPRPTETGHIPPP